MSVQFTSPTTLLVRFAFEPPAVTQSGQGGGLSVPQVDARVRAGVADWAETGDASAIPASKLTNAPGGDDPFDWATEGNVDRLPAAKMNAEAPHAFLVSGGGTSGRISVQRFDGQTYGLDLVAGVEPWARNRDSDTIPKDKITDAIAGQHLLVSNRGTIIGAVLPTASGLDENAVDARVRAGVHDWAEQGNNTAIPASKLTNAPSTDQTARDAAAAAQTRADAAATAATTAQTTADSKVDAAGARAVVSDWAEQGNADAIPANKLANAPVSGGSGITSTQARSLISDWAEEGDTSAIPAAKLTNAPSGSGLDENAVDVRVRAGVADWAEFGDTTAIPASKLSNAPGGQGGASITLVEDLPATADLDRDKIYGDVDAGADQSARALYYRKETAATSMRVRMDDISSRSQFTTYSAFGYADFSDSTNLTHGSGGAIYPAVPTGIHAIFRTYSDSTRQLQWRLRVDTTLVDDDTLFLDIRTPGGALIDNLAVTKTAGESDHVSAALTADPFGVQLHDTYEVRIRADDNERDTSLVALLPAEHAERIVDAEELHRAEGGIRNYAKQLFDRGGGAAVANVPVMSAVTTQTGISLTTINQVLATTLQPPADADAIWLRFKMAGTHNSVSQRPYSPWFAFDATLWRGFTAAAAGSAPLDDNLFGQDVGGSPAEFQISRVLNASSESVIGVSISSTPTTFSEVSMRTSTLVTIGG